MIQNLAWAVGYNVIAIPLAAGVLYPNFMFSPAMGASTYEFKYSNCCFQCKIVEVEIISFGF